MTHAASAGLAATLPMTYRALISLDFKSYANTIFAHSRYSDLLHTPKAGQQLNFYFTAQCRVQVQEGERAEVSLSTSAEQVTLRFLQNSLKLMTSRAVL